MEERKAPRVVVFSLASCFGCQLQITNQEDRLMDILGQIDLQHWQMTSSVPCPDEYDIAIIEGAVTDQRSIDLVKDIRSKAAVVIAIGSCAITGGIPGMAAQGLQEMANLVYPEGTPAASGTLVEPRAISAVIDIDYEVRCCPIDFWEFVDVLEAALIGSNRRATARTMCGDCKRNESDCFYAKGELCLGLVTTAGCHARCVNLGRPCNGCRGISTAANLEAARVSVERYGVNPADFDKALEMFNETNPMYREYIAAHKE